MAPHPLYELAIEITQIYRTGINVTRVIFEQDGDLEWERQMLLRYIDRHGSLTVTQMARRHKVTRQRISSVVQQLVDMELFELEPHPKHRQSKLITLSTKGQEYIDQHDQKVCAFLAKTLFDVSRDDLDVFSRVAGKLRNAFENEYILLEYERPTQVTSR